MSNDRLFRALSALTELVTKLRGPRGCPWDAKQTDSTIKIYLLEEAFEVLDAIETGTPGDVCQELGDLLFHIIFFADMASDKGDFDLAEVMETITEKMIRRHPHVFGHTNVNSSEEVSDNWAKIKRAEKGAPETASTLLRKVSSGMPALLRAHRLSQRASKAGFDWQDRNKVFDTVKEAFEDLNRSIIEGEKDGVGDRIGGLLFDLVNLARHWGHNAESIMRDANQNYIEHFKAMEEELDAMGIGIENATPGEMGQAWEKIMAGAR